VLRHHDLAERVPHYLPSNNALQCSITHDSSTGEGQQTENPLALVAALLSALSDVDSTTTNRSGTAKLVAGLASAGEAGTWIADQDRWRLSPLAEESVRALQPLVTEGPDGTKAVSALAQWCAEQHIDAYGRRALMIALLTVPTSPFGAEGSARYLSAAAVANLMSADTVTQNAVLRTFLSPRNTDSSGSTAASAVAAPALPPALSELSLISSVETDIMTALKLSHAALWLRDLSPLAEIIQKHALSTFRRTKSSIQVPIAFISAHCVICCFAIIGNSCWLTSMRTPFAMFSLALAYCVILLIGSLHGFPKIFLEMVLVGKEDTLLQLAKTDKEKSGRQLLALLTLDDGYSSEKTRKSLQKNAFALMKLHRYRDAAAVFLLADPPFIKEACSVLNRQFADPMLALLVTRLVEYRQGQRRHAAMLAMSPSIGVTTPVAALASSAIVPQDVSSLVLSSVEGYALGAAARALLLNDVLPSLILASQRTGLRSIQQLRWQQEQQGRQVQPGSIAEEVAPMYATVRAVDALLLSLVCALWLQDRGVLDATLRTLCGRYSLVDACTASSGTFTGEF
jgi:hypothetical protein